jgi:formylglycine-generating enzyme required for sulfatase activity
MDNIYYKDAFISYGRRESLNFVARLHQQLKLAGYHIWFDKVNIPDGDDYAQRINHGIESAHNFIYVMAPRCLTSPHCLMELEYARLLGKRVIPVNQISVKIDSRTLSDKDQQTMVRFYQFYDLPDQQIRTTQDVFNRSRELIGKSDWLDAKEKLSDEDCQKIADWAQPYENYWDQHENIDDLNTPDLPVFGQPINELPGVIERVIDVFEREPDYVHQHTNILAQALRWQQHFKTTPYLLVSPERTDAEKWLLKEFTREEQPPCQPSALVSEFICESRKHAENGMTDLFVCYDTQDQEIRDSVVQSLSRHLLTCWTPSWDIQQGTTLYAYAIERGIEGADNVLFFISPASVKSEYCQRELTHALEYHKRIVPLLVAPTSNSDIREELQSLQYIDLTTQTDYQTQIDQILKILKQDQEYHHRHKELLVRAKKWAIEKRKPMLLLQGHNLESAKAWLHLAEQRQQHLPLPLHQEFITASDNATRQVGTELFISYSRQDSDFVHQLNTRLTEAGKTVWFDQEMQINPLDADRVDFEPETFNSIDHADNFIFVVSPPSVNSPYCIAELNHAASRGKRIMTLWHCDIEPNQMPAALLAAQRIEIDFSNRANFEAAFLELVLTLERHQTYIHQHTQILTHALRWQQNQKVTEYLLIDEERRNAEQWLLEFRPPNQPPCQPIGLICEFICEARKNAENLMTDIFVCYDVSEKIGDSVVQSLARHAITCWTPDRDKKGEQYERVIDRGIEGADNFLFFISPASVKSDYCQRELDHALQYHKRIVPLLITPTPISDQPDALRTLPYVDLTNHTSQADYDSHLDEILNILKSDQDYYKQHKVLLVRALKWAPENQKPSFLLRGHNLENAKTWLRLSEKRQHSPLDLHDQLIKASDNAKGQLGTEVFISYSRKDSDFARNLNTALQEAGKTTWFDQESISTGVDFEKEIFKGIDSADNFLFVLSPDAVGSEYCEREVDYAAEQSKRFISVLHRETATDTMPDTLRKIQWIDFQNTAFDKSFLELVQAIERDREHVHQHTVLQQRATEWADNKRSPDFLLNQTACAKAETWRDTAKETNKQPAPTELQQEFIQQSRSAIQKANRRRNIFFGFVGLLAVVAVILAGFAVVQMKKAEDAYEKVDSIYEHSKKEQFTKMAEQLEKEPGRVFRDTLKNGGFGPEMIWIPAGTFRMGDIQDAGEPDEKPVHEVSIQRFAISRYEITVAEFKKFVDASRHQTDAEKGDGCYVIINGIDRQKKEDANWRNPYFPQKDNQQPVVCVSFNDANAYIKWLNEQTNKTEENYRYRLPSEAEWEYAARSKMETKYYWGHKSVFLWGNFLNSGHKFSGLQTAPVGSFVPNYFGIYDTAGNVWEWVADPYHDSYKGAPTDGSVWDEGGENRVLRGGSSFNLPKNCRAADRYHLPEDTRIYEIGFRVAADLVARTP